MIIGKSENQCLQETILDKGVTEWVFKNLNVNLYGYFH